MRWNETCTLIAKGYELDDEGVPVPTCEETDAFCNAFAVGATTWSSMYEMGISVDAELQLRTCDYAGQRDVLYREEHYSVERVEEAGDFTRIFLRHQQSDSAEETPRPDVPGGEGPEKPEGEQSDG